MLVSCRAHQQQQQQHQPQQQQPEGKSLAANSSSHGNSSSSSNSVIRQVLELPLPPAEAAALDPDCLSEASILDRQLEKALLAASSQLYEQMVSVQLVHHAGILLA
jgi:hypothetical protein